MRSSRTLHVCRAPCDRAPRARRRRRSWQAAGWRAAWRGPPSASRGACGGAVRAAAYHLWHIISSMTHDLMSWHSWALVLNLWHAHLRERRCDRCGPCVMRAMCIPLPYMYTHPPTSGIHFINYSIKNHQAHHLLHTLKSFSPDPQGWTEGFDDGARGPRSAGAPFSKVVGAIFLKSSHSSSRAGRGRQEEHQYARSARRRGAEPAARAGAAHGASPDPRQGDGATPRARRLHGERHRDCVQHSGAGLRQLWQVRPGSGADGPRLGHRDGAVHSAGALRFGLRRSRQGEGHADHRRHAQVSPHPGTEEPGHAQRGPADAPRWHSQV